MQPVYAYDDIAAIAVREESSNAIDVAVGGGVPIPASIRAARTADGAEVDD